MSTAESGQDGRPAARLADAPTLKPRRVLGSTRALRAFAEHPVPDRSAKFCYILMAGYARDSGRCYVSEGALGRQLHADPRQIRRWLRSLEAAGFIRPEWRPGRPTHYLFLEHPIFAPPAAETPDMDVRGGRTLVSGGADMGVRPYRSGISRGMEVSKRAVVKVGSVEQAASKRPLAPELLSIRLALHEHAQAIGQFNQLLTDDDLIQRIAAAANGNPRAAAALISKISQYRFSPRAVRPQPWPKKLGYWVTVVAEASRNNWDRARL